MRRRGGGDTGVKLYTMKWKVVELTFLPYRFTKHIFTFIKHFLPCSQNTFSLSFKHYHCISQTTHWIGEGLTKVHLIFTLCLFTRHVCYIFTLTHSHNLPEKTFACSGVSTPHTACLVALMDAKYSHFKIHKCKRIWITWQWPKKIRMVMSNINNVQRYRHTGFKNWEDEIMTFQLLSIWLVTVYSIHNL